MKFVTNRALGSLGLLLILACDKQIDAGDGDGQGSDVGNSAEGDASADGGVDCEGEGEGNGDTEGEGGETGEAADCPIGEYVPLPFTELPDWSNVSGLVGHVVSSHSDPELAAHYIDARFYVSAWEDDSELCVENIVEPNGVDSCWVWYSEGWGKGGDAHGDWFEDIPASMVSFDLGDGPIALEFWDGGELNPMGYSAGLPAPPAGVPFGGTATFSATFDGPTEVEFEMDVPNDLLPLNHPLDTTELSSEELATWTWATPGSSTPLRLRISLGATPSGTGWTQWVDIQCEVTDDGAFAFPAEYIDLARDRLGPDVYASATLTRKSEGSQMLEGKQLLWRSWVGTAIDVEVID